MANLVVPQVARQMATLDQMLGGRLTINIISSDIPGHHVESGPATSAAPKSCTSYENSWMGIPWTFQGDHVSLTLDPPRIRTVSGKSPLFYFGGLSPAAGSVRPRCRCVPDVAGRDVGNAGGEGRHGRPGGAPRAGR